MKVHTNGCVQHGANTDIDGDYFFFKQGREVGVIKFLEPMNPTLNYYEYLIVNRGQESFIGIGVCMPLRGTPLHTSGPHTFNTCGYCHNVVISPNTFCDAYTSFTPLTHMHPSHTTPFPSHRWVSAPIRWTDNQAGTRTAVVIMLIMGTSIMREAVVLCLVQLAQMETGWVVGWTSVPTTALVMSMCSLQRMGSRLGGGGGETRKRWGGTRRRRGDEEKGEERR